MAPGAFAILAPLLRRKKKYEKLETEDPERKALKAAATSRGASNDEMERLNCKIEKLVTSLSKEDVEPASSAEDECIVCNTSRAVMQVAPCGHQCQCRICFIYKIQEAVASRDLPLRCLICNVKIFRVKNNSNKRRPAGPTWSDSGSPPKTNTGKPLAKSVSGYSIVLGDLPHSDSNHSLSSDVSNVSTQSRDSRSSLRSSSSWFSLGSLSSFQAGSFTPDRATMARVPRAHSLVSKGSNCTNSAYNKNDNNNNINNKNNNNNNNNNTNQTRSKPDNQSSPSHVTPDSNNNNSAFINLHNPTTNVFEQKDELRSSNVASTGLSRASNLRRSRTIPNDMGGSKRRGMESSSSLLDPGTRFPPDLAETAFSMGTIAEEED